MNGAKLEIFVLRKYILQKTVVECTRWLSPHLSVNAIFKYRIYSIERRPRINAADGSKITRKRHT